MSMLREFFDWPSWARWALTLSFLTLVNWMLLAPAGVFHGVHLFLAHQDKLAHFGIFLVLALLVRWSVPAGADVPSSARCRRGFRCRGESARLAAMAVLVLYAASIEFCQPLLTKAGRQFEWLDLASNYGGLFFGWLLFGVAAGGSRDLDDAACRRDRAGVTEGIPAL